MNTDNILRVGIIGTGRIATRFADEIRYTESVKISAVYNPGIESANSFVEDNLDLSNGFDNVSATDSLEELAQIVDAVYIASPHETHFAYTKKMLEYGKHVLCEKTFALKRNEAASLFNLAAEKKLVLMEAVKTAYCPGFIKLLDIAKAGVIGKIHDVEACFTKIGSSAGREMWGEYGGSFLELATYPMLAVAKLLGTENTGLHIWSLDSVTGVDSYTKMTFIYPDAVATIKTGLGVKSEGELIVAGEKGYIKVPSPWWLTKRIEIHHENPGRVEVYEAPFEKSGLRYEINAFAGRIKNQHSDTTTENQEDFQVGLYPLESIWFAGNIEEFLNNRGEKTKQARLLLENAGKTQDSRGDVRIWGHRGCSMAYPENTLPAFLAAANIKGITGIELDVQLTSDGQMVVIHDEKLERTTTGIGYVKDYTLDMIKSLSITPSGKNEPYVGDDGKTLTIPTLEEVFEALKPFCEEKGLKINIELKNSIIRYDGMEQMVIDLVHRYGLCKNVIYSSFNHSSVGLVKSIDPKAATGILSGDILLCMEGMIKYNADALHPMNTGMPVNRETVEYIKNNNIPVRMWNCQEPLFGQNKPFKGPDNRKYAVLGATDIFTNAPEIYLM